MALSAATLTLTACGGGGDDTGSAGTSGSFAPGGGGMLGPLTDAVVTVYKMDYKQYRWWV